MTRECIMTKERRRAIGAKNADQQVRLIRRLREIRIANGIPVPQVAEVMGVDQTMVYRFERGGTNFTASTLRKYAKAVGALLSLDAFPADNDPECQHRRIADTPHARRASQVSRIRVSSRSSEEPSSPPSRSAEPVGWAMAGVAESFSKKLVSHE